MLGSFVGLHKGGAGEHRPLVCGVQSWARRFLPDDAFYPRSKFAPSFPGTEQPSIIVVAVAGCGEGEIAAHCGGLDPSAGGREVCPRVLRFLLTDELRAAAQAFQTDQRRFLVRTGEGLASKDPVVVAVRHVAPPERCKAVIVET